MKLFIYRERGQALALIALASIVLFGFVALAIDGSAKLSDRRHAQNAADTAALAAALAKVNAQTAGLSETPAECPPTSGSPSAVCSALLTAGFFRAQSNGYNGDLVTNTVEIYSPPRSGYYTGNANYVQVTITSQVKTYFAKLLGFAQTTNSVQAVAYTKQGGDLADGAMIISYDPSPNCSTSGTGGYSVSVSGSSTVNLNGGGIFMNSDEVCGFTIPNCADLNILGGAGLNTVGTNNINTTGCTFDPPLSNNYEQDAIAIPEDISWPDEPPECGMTPATAYKFPTQIYGADNKWHDQWLISPGYYTDFPNTTLVTNKSYIYMKSGVYCIDLPSNQDLSWSAVDAAALIGSTDPSKNPYVTYNPTGVTLYLKQANGFAINGNGPTYLDASTTGDLQGYLIVQTGIPTDHPTCTINGGSVIDMNGLVFAPYCNFQINGKAGETAAINAQLLGWDIKINGANTINFNYNPSNQVKIKRKIGLMK